MTSKSQAKINQQTVERFFDGTHLGQFEVIDDTVSETIVTHGFPGGDPASPEQYKQWFRQFGSAFSGMTAERLATVAGEDHVAVHWRIEVDHTGPYAGVPPTNKRVSVTGMVFYRMEQSRIAETWLQIDEVALLTQIGALPMAAVA